MSLLPCRWCFLLAVLAVRLAAQEVVVMAPAWADPENPAGDSLPVFKQPPTPAMPDVLANGTDINYAVIWKSVGSNGQVLQGRGVFSNPYLEEALNREPWPKWLPARKGGVVVDAVVWYGVIFNPRSAAQNGPEATARLIQVAPTPIAPQKLPHTRLPCVVWTKLDLSETGEIRSFSFESEEWEQLRPEVEGSLRRWKFLPARKNNCPVASSIKAPVIFCEPFEARATSAIPRAIHQVPPEYPLAMKRSGMEGEVLLEITVRKDGSVANPVVVRSNNPVFEQPAIKSILGWKFEPARLGGVPVNTRMQIPLVFNFEGDDEMPAKNYMEVKASEEQQKKLPEILRFDVPPKNKNLVFPVYPYPLIKGGQSGKAIVAFLVKADGSVGLAQVIEASCPEFGSAAVAAVEQYEFTPALKDQRPTQALLRTELTFLLPWGDTETKLRALEDKHPERIVPAPKLDVRPKAVFSKAPRFPTSLGQVEKGSAMVECLIAEDGTVHLARFVSATDPAFGYAAVQAVSLWRFEPPKFGGKPVITRVKIPFEFKNAAASAGERPAAATAPAASGN